VVVQKTINNLKERPTDERKVVAGGIAITLIIVLLTGWAILFFKRIQSGSQTVNLDSGAQGEFDFSSTREARETINASRGQSNEDLTDYRDNAAAAQLRGEQQIYLQDIENNNQFGNSNF